MCKTQHQLLSEGTSNDKKTNPSKWTNVSIKIICLQFCVWIESFVFWLYLFELSIGLIAFIATFRFSIWVGEIDFCLRNSNVIECNRSMKLCARDSNRHLWDSNILRKIRSEIFPPTFRRTTKRLIIQALHLNDTVWWTSNDVQYVLLCQMP